MTELIANKYRVLKTLGQGAMGEVFLVLPPKGEPVALKLLKSLEDKAGKEAMDQFENEFRTLKKLSHPNIGKIHDYGFDIDLKKVFFTLPWLKGTDLFEATESLSFLDCELLFVQMFRALNYLHQKGIIHCDLKPGNVYIEDGQVKLIDFGLAGYWGENIVGTPTYLAPEVFRGDHHTIASDLYAAGVICYNCLTRSQPFSGKSIQEVYDRHRKYTPPPISEINPHVPKYFSDIVATLLNKKPEERFPSAAAVIQEIDAFSPKTYTVETKETLLSYLPTESELIGKNAELQKAHSALENFENSEDKTPYHIVLIDGPKNVGKTRLIAKLKNDLQLKKITVESIVPPIGEQDREIILKSQAVMIEAVDHLFINESEQHNFSEIKGVIEQKIIETTDLKSFYVFSATEADNFQSLVKIFPPEECKITKISLTPYTLSETKEFLKRIIGDEGVPQIFIEQFHNNTEGLPGVALQLIKTMIETNILFDENGRWNPDLLSHLDHAFDALEISESLEQEFEIIYNSLTGDEENIVNWLSLCPHPLHFGQIQKLSKIEGLDQILDSMIEKNILREDQKNYTLYRSVFQNFIQNNLPDAEVKERHLQLANPKLGLEKKWSIHHLSLAGNDLIQLKATLKLAEIYQKEGDREQALRVYLDLIMRFSDVPESTRIEWHIEAATLFIWLNRFDEAIEFISLYEKDLKKKNPSIKQDRVLLLLEKKGLAYLHQHKIEQALIYFENGLKFSQKTNQCNVQKLRYANDLAEIDFLKGQNEKAIETFKRTRIEQNQLPEDEAKEVTNNDLGHVYLGLRDFENSVRYLKEDIQQFSLLKNKEPLARALYSFAVALNSLSNSESARKAYNECIKICRMIHYYPLLLRAYNGLGNLDLVQKQHAAALENYEKAIAIAIRLKEDTSKAALLFNQAYIYKEQNNNALALRRCLMAKQSLAQKEDQLLPHEESLLSRCYAELAELTKDDVSDELKPIHFLLERLKLVECSTHLKTEEFSVRLDLAKMYLECRLFEQLDNEISELEKLANNDEQKNEISSLKEQINDVTSYNDQDDTGKLSIMDESNL